MMEGYGDYTAGPAYNHSTGLSASHKKKRKSKQNAYTKQEDIGGETLSKLHSQTSTTPRNWTLP